MGLKSIYSNNQVFQHLRNLHNHLAAITSEPVGIFACCFHCCAQENNFNLFSYGILSTLGSLNLRTWSRAEKTKMVHRLHVNHLMMAILQRRAQVFHDRIDHLETMTSDDLLERYRFRRPALGHIFDILKPHMEERTLRNHSLSKEMQVYVTKRDASMCDKKLHKRQQTVLTNNFEYLLSNSLTPNPKIICLQL